MNCQKCGMKMIEITNDSEVKEKFHIQDEELEMALENANFFECSNCGNLATID